MQPDQMPPRREPAINAPGVIVAVLGVLLLVHGVRQVIDPDLDLRILLELAFIPGRLYAALWPDGFAQVIDHVVTEAPGGEGAQRLAMAQYLLNEDAGIKPWTWLTYALLHGSWGHVLVNGAWLLAFGAPLARRLGTVRTLVLLALTAVAGAGFHFAVHPTDTQPVIGASASASGVMAAVTRFAFVRFAPSPANDTPLLTLKELFTQPRTALFILVWFAINILFGVLAEPLGIAPGGIAWEAHIGGFLGGLLLMPLIDPYRPYRRG